MAAMNNPILPLLPPWLRDEQARAGTLFPTVEERMEYVLALAERNIREKTGGPFAAAVFQTDTGKLVASGVNLVVRSSCSHAHAEMIALALAQQKLATYDLGAEGLPSHQLVTSCEPCAMCFGAIPWSGVRSVVAGARDEDARAIGFDEGPKVADWGKALEERGITVIRDIQRQTASTILTLYAKAGGKIY